MQPIFRLLVCTVLLWACVGVAEDVDIENCFSPDLVPATRFVACRAAAEAGNARAQYRLGYMYDVGQGVSQDSAEAMKWYRRAAEQGYARAQLTLGYRYDAGQGVPQDSAEAVKWYRRAAEQGDANAQYSLGLRYTTGLGVSQDYAEAVKWYRRAADQGYARAQYNLGTAYYNGYGVTQDYALAHMWFNLAGTTDAVGEHARELRNTVAKLMTPVQIAEAQRLAREWTAAHRAGAE